ncbi:MAG: hypothetical protein AAGI91_15870 [Bacteroidota bacterium]
MKDFSLGLIAVLFVAAGLLHFVIPDLYVQIVPPYFPFPLALVYISGLAEILGGLGVLVQKTRAWAGVGLAALLVAVFPANLYMAMEPEAVGLENAALGLWLRLPLQFVLIAWVWWATQRKRAEV